MNTLLLICFVLFQVKGIEWCGNSNMIECYESIEHCDQIGFEVEGSVIVFGDDADELPVFNCELLDFVDVIHQQRKQIILLNNNPQQNLFENSKNSTLKSSLLCCDSSTFKCFNHDYCQSCFYENMDCYFCPESNPQTTITSTTYGTIKGCQGENESGFKCQNNFCLSDASGTASCVYTTNTGCLTCPSLYSCTSCDFGYYLSGISCLSCDSNCAIGKCSNSTGICSQCNNGYYPDPYENKRCVSCLTMNHCDTCNSTTEQCFTCNYGYYPNPFDKTQCASCDSQCPKL